LTIGDDKSDICFITSRINKYLTKRVYERHYSDVSDPATVLNFAKSNFRFSNLASVLLQRQPDHCDRLVVRRVTRHSWVTQSRRIRSSDACQFLLSRPQLMMINC